MSAKRQLAKRAAFAIAWVIASPLIAAVAVERRLSNSDQLYLLGAQLISLAPGIPGVYLRAAFYWSSLRECSWETHIGFGSIFVRRDATVGRHASCGSYCIFGDADLGERAMVGSRVSVPSGKRQHLDSEGKLSHASRNFERVTIGADCWIGEGAIILADVGRGSIVAAGAVVSTLVPPSSRVSGNPARIVGSVQLSRETEST